MREYTNGAWEYAKGTRVHKEKSSLKGARVGREDTQMGHASTQRVREYTNGAYECTKGRACALVAFIPPFPSNAN